jgi:hypothetical protein
MLIMSLTSTLHMHHYQYELYDNIDTLMKQKNLEIMLVKYYIETMKSDLLLSDSCSDDSYLVKYYVEDMWSYYIIDTSIEFDDISYGFRCHINTGDYKLTSFKYI